jgi:hypothetical protein
MRKSVIWIPVVMVGAMVYWTLALGFGGLSLMTVTLFQDNADTSDSATGSVKDSYQSITVNLTGAAELEQAQAHEAVPVTVDLVADPDPAGASVGMPSGLSAGSDESGQGAHGGGRTSDQGPGQTAF